MILHLVHDEKIINRLISSFEEALPQNNLFICFTKKPLKYVEKRDNVIVYNRKAQIDENLFTNVDKVLIHYLSLKKILFIEKFLKKDVKCYWFVWGTDIYNKLLASQGFPVYYEKQYLSKTIRFLLFLGKLHIYDYRSRRILSFIKHRLDSVVSFCDYPLLKSYLDKENKSELIEDFFYYPIEQILGEELLDKYASGNTILLGNSASITNNHVYAFHHLSKVDIGDRQIVAPLNYVINDEYINHVISEGEATFGKEKFHPLREFLPLQEYNKLMTSAEICVYGNWRQEAMGNITIALYLGSKVFMSNKSPLYKWFKSVGAIIFELETVRNDSFQPLSQEEKEHNRNLMRSLFSKEKQIETIKKYWGN